jgi:hypothetical protein
MYFLVYSSRFFRWDTATLELELELEVYQVARCHSQNQYPAWPFRRISPWHSIKTKVHNFVKQTKKISYKKQKIDIT